MKWVYEIIIIMVYHWFVSLDKHEDVFRLKKDNNN